MTAFSPLVIGSRSATLVLLICNLWLQGLSVPSSSGQGLQRWELLKWGTSFGDLSVPSSSGQGLQRYVAPDEFELGGQTFSPLVIGSRSATVGRVPGAGRGQDLSVPSSSGQGLQPLSNARSARSRSRLSVPSSSGQGLQREPARELHDSARLLSVPSSSSQGLQLCALFLICWSSLSFQSPRHRVKVCNGIEFRPSRIKIQTFSPLVIGSRSATLERLLPEAEDLVLSVPSSSGQGLQPPWAAARISPIVAFSPLVIGSRSATLAAAGRCLRGARAFSPLVIGSRSATTCPVLSAPQG